MEKFYTIENLAELFQVSTRTILREKKSGKMPFILIRGMVRFRERDIQAYLDSMQFGGKAGSEASPPAIATAPRSAK